MTCSIFCIAGVALSVASIALSGLNFNCELQCDKESGCKKDNGYEYVDSLTFCTFDLFSFEPEDAFVFGESFNCVT